MFRQRFDIVASNGILVNNEHTCHQVKTKL